MAQIWYLYRGVWHMYYNEILHLEFCLLVSCFWIILALFREKNWAKKLYLSMLGNKIWTFEEYIPLFNSYLLRKNLPFMYNLHTFTYHANRNTHPLLPIVLKLPDIYIHFSGAKVGMGNFRKNIHRNLTIRFLWI